MTAGRGCGSGAAASSAHGTDWSMLDAAGSKFSIMTGLGNPINSVSCVTPRFLAR